MKLPGNLASQKQLFTGISRFINGKAIFQLLQVVLDTFLMTLRKNYRESSRFTLITATESRTHTIRNIAKDLCRTKFEKSRLTEKWARNFVSRRSESFKMRMRIASPAATKDRAGPYKEDKVVFLNTLRSVSPTIKSALEAGRFANTDKVQVRFVQWLMLNCL